MAAIHRKALAGIRDRVPAEDGEARAVLDALFTAAPVGLAHLDADLMFVRVNERLAEIDGLPPADHIGRTLRGVLGPLADDLEPACRRVLETGSPVLLPTVEGEVPPGSGTVRSFLASCLPIRTGSDVVGVCAIVEEVTERRAAEASLREAEERFRLISEMTSDFAGVASVREDGSIALEWVSEAAKRVIGYDADRANAVGVLGVFHPDDIPLVRERFAEVAAGHTVATEARLVTAWGEVRWVTATLRPLPDPETGRVTRMVGAWRDITDEKLARMRLEESEERLRLLFEGCPEAIFQTTSEGAWIAVNQRAAEMFGYDSPEDLFASVPSAADLYEDPGRREELMAALREHGRVRDFRARVRRRDGETFWASATIRAIQDDEGEVVALHGFVSDISEQVAAEEALRANERWLRAVLEHSSDALAVVAVEGGVPHVTYADPAMEELLGYTADELRQLPSTHFVHPDDLPAASAAIEEILGRPGASTRFEVRLVRKDGGVRWVEHTSTNLLDDPVVRSLVTNNRDITRRKLAEEALREREARYRLLAETTADIAFSKRFAEDGGVIIEWRSRSGWIRDRAQIGRPHPLEEDVHPDDLPALQAARDTVRRGERAHVELRLTAGGDDVRIFEFDLAPRYERDGGPVIGYFGAGRDVTERRRAERERTELLLRLTEAEEAERLRIARELHDHLGALLAAIGLRATSLAAEAEGATAEGLTRLAEDARSAAGQVRTLAWTLRPPQLDETGPADAIARLAADTTERTGVRVDVEASGLRRPVPPSVATCVFRVVQEALTNVGRHAGATSASVVVSRRAGTLRVVVEDDGEGFDPAAETEGLGLRGMRERAALLDGRLDVSSAPGRGTTVRLEVPVP